MTHKHEDLKITAVRYYLNNNVSYAETCRIFDCSERSLKRWIERYEEENEIKRHNRPPVSYKITQEQINYAIRRLRENEQITMLELTKKLENRFPDFDLTPHRRIPLFSFIHFLCPFYHLYKNDFYSRFK
ncbi:helix-turn-helix domain-containing protein [bacterium]|nr:helix-turn-helix domain-containing protein [bacterium]